MSIDRRPSGKWRVRYPGAPSKSFDRKADAEAYERQVREAKQTGRVDLLDADLKTLAELAAEHIAAVSGEWSERTWTTNRTLWSAHVDARILEDEDRQWCHPIADMTLRQLRPSEIEKWKVERLKDGAGPSSIDKTMALMQTMFDRAMRDEIVRTNPVKLVKRPRKRKPGGGAQVVAPESVERIRSKLDETGRMMVSLLAYSGMRPGEARALHWEHVSAKSIHIEGATNPDGSGKLTKTEKVRTITRVVRPLADDLKAYRTLQGDPPDSALIFPRDDGEAWTEYDWRNWRKRKFMPAAEKVGVKIGRAYDLRHSAASLWLHEGINPVQVAKWMGHDMQTLFRDYAHVIEELDQTRRVKAEKAIEAARKKVGQDTSRTHRPVQHRPRQSKQTAEKSRPRAKTAV